MFLHWLQALQLPQQLEPKTQARPVPGPEAASVPAAAVTTPPGQAAPANNRMCFVYY